MCTRHSLEENQLRGSKAKEVELDTKQSVYIIRTQNTECYIRIFSASESLAIIILCTLEGFYALH